MDSLLGQFQYVNMAEKEPEVVQIDDDDDDVEELQAKGPRNCHLAEEYARTLDEAMEDFRDLIREDRKDALKVMVKALKRKMTSQFEEMKNADIEVILKCVKDTSCLTL